MLHKEDNIATQNLHAGFVQAHCTYEDSHRAGPSHLLTDPAASLEGFCHKGHTRVMFEDWGSLQVSLVNYDKACHLPTISDPCNSSSTSYFSFGNLNPQPEISESILNLEASYAFSSLNPLVLSCEEEQPNSHLMFSHGGSGVWPDTTIFSNHQLHHLNSKCNTILPQEINCLEGASSHEPVVNILKENKREEESIWLYPEEMVPGDDLQKFRGAEGGSHKRPYMTGDVPSSKRHCDGSHKSSKAGEPFASKYPHSIAAKNRRERISERLKILQDLVPNSTKLDLVTMLDKAISYVKFLQLQVKVLTTDEFWPTNDGRVPDVARMMETIDAVLSSHKDSF